VFDLLLLLGVVGVDTPDEGGVHSLTFGSARVSDDDDEEDDDIQEDIREMYKTSN